MAFHGKQWVHEPDPVFRTPAEALRHYEKRQRRWEEGFDGLPGLYYKFLTEYKIKDRYEGQIIKPNYRQADHEQIFPWVEECIKKNRDGLWITQRGAAKSTIMGGPVVMETAINYPGSQTIITADTLTNVQDIFENKLRVAYENLNTYLKPPMTQMWPSIAGKAMPVIQFQSKKRGTKEFNDDSLGSIIRGLDTASKGEGNKVEGHGAKMLLVDEIFKHPHVDSLYSKSQALTKRGKRKVGSIFLVGSCSDVTAKGLETAIDLWNNAGTHGINRLFVSAAYLNEEYEVYDQDGNLTDEYVSVLDKWGNIDHKKAEEIIKKNRLVLEKLPNKRKAIEDRLQYPLSIDEILDVNFEGWWDEETIEQQKIQKNAVYISVKAQDYSSSKSQCDRPAILIEDPLTKQPKIIYTNNRSNAHVFIWREPEPNVHYGMGTDPIPGSTSNEDGSDHVSIVKSFDSNEYVAYLQIRSYDMSDICKRQILLQRLYNNCINLTEKNSAGAMVALYREWKLLSMLAKTPRRFRTKTGTVDYGLNKDSNATQLQQLVRQYVKENMGLIFLERFHKEFLDYPFKNTDLMSAMAMVEALHEDYRGIARMMENRKFIPKDEVRYVTDSFGRRVMSIGAPSFEMKTGEINVGDLWESFAQKKR